MRGNCEDQFADIIQQSVAEGVGSIADCDEAEVLDMFGGVVHS